MPTTQGPSTPPQGMPVQMPGQGMPGQGMPGQGMPGQGMPGQRTGTAPGAPTWQPPGGQPPGGRVPPQPGPPAWEQRPGPPAGPPPSGAQQKRSRTGLWWGLGAAALVVIVAAGLLVFLLTRPLDPPSGVEAALQDGDVSVTWQAVEDAASYEVFRNDESIATTEEASFLDTEAPGGTEHRYSVVAVDADGDRSETVAAESSVITPVDAPASVSATADGPDVLVEWAEVTGAERYEVTRNGELLADDVTETSWTDTGVPLGDHTYQVTAVDEDGEGSTASATVEIFAAGPWQEAYRIGAAFSELVGDAPGSGAWNGATCQPDNEVPGTEALVYCEYADGIYVEVIEFRDSAQRNTRVAEIAGLADPAVGTWAYGSGPAEGDLYLSVAGTNPPWRFLTFYGGGNELFAVYAEWDGHTQEELRDTWFAGAPF